MVDSCILLNLPIDLIEDITSHLNIKDVYCLYMAGNKVFREMLGALGGVKSLTLPLQSTNALYPLFVFSMRGLLHLDTFVSRRLVVELLPSTLQTLRLVGSNLLNLFRKDPESARYSGCLARLDPKPFYDLPSILPCLQTMALYGIDIYEASFFEVLPPSLTSFSVGTSCMSLWAWQIVNKLPKSITELTVNVFTYKKPVDVDESEADQPIEFPGSLTKLEWKYPLQLQAILSALPSSLENLTIRLKNGYLTDLKNCWALLPRRLLELCTDTWPYGSDALSSLPQGLQRLDISTHHTIHSADLKMLPPSLTYLGVSGIQLERNEDLANFPRTLTTLPVWECEQLDCQCIPYLPTDLKVLHLGTINPESPLPSRLETLTIAVLDSKVIPFLPPTLHSLSSSHSSDISFQMASTLPRGLTCLSLQTVSWKSVDAPAGLPRLRSLSLRGPRKQLAGLRHLPNSLTSLYINLSEEIPNEESWMASFARLNALSSLTIVGPHSKLSPSMVTYLPSYLTSLTVALSKMNDLTMLKGLPEGIRALDVRSHDAKLENCELCPIPPSLTTLVLPSSSWLFFQYSMTSILFPPLLEAVYIGNRAINIRKKI